MAWKLKKSKNATPSDEVTNESQVQTINEDSDFQMGTQSVDSGPAQILSGQKFDEYPVANKSHGEPNSPAHGIDFDSDDATQEWSLSDLKPLSSELISPSNLTPTSTDHFTPADDEDDYLFSTVDLKHDPIILDQPLLSEHAVPQPANIEDESHNLSARFDIDSSEPLLTESIHPEPKELITEHHELLAETEHEPVELITPLSKHIEWEDIAPIEDEKSVVAQNHEAPELASEHDELEPTLLVGTGLDSKQPVTAAPDAISTPEPISEPVKVAVAQPIPTPSLVPAPQAKKIARLSIKIGMFTANYEIAQATLLIGRTDPKTGISPDITIDFDDAISRRHAQITTADNHYYVSDLESKNGSKLNGATLEPHILHELKQGDVIRVGEKTDIIFDLT